MSFSRGLNQSFESCWSLQPFTLGLRRRLWLWIQLRIFELSFRFHLLCTQRFACRLARREFHPTSPPLRLLLFGMFTNQIMDWFHLLLFLHWGQKVFSCVSLTLTITPGLRLDSELQKIIVHFLKKILKQSEKKKTTVDIKTQASSPIFAGPNILKIDILYILIYVSNVTFTFCYRLLSYCPALLCKLYMELKCHFKYSVWINIAVH